MILIVDDDHAQRRLVGAMLATGGRPCAEAADGAAALDWLVGEEGAAARLVLLDLVMPGMDGMETLKRLRAARPALPVIVLTSHGSVSNAVAAIKAGADDFLVKPVSPERLEASVANALRLADLSSELRRLSDQGAPGGFETLIAEAPATREAARLAARGARSNIPILLEGESGVGKEVFARAIHAASPRAGGPFVAVNCGALPETLVESILFGHEKGAFTGAIARREGRFREADGGTIFLDEIGELPLDAQVKLLRVLQTGEVDPVGAAGGVRSDFRLISATNRDLAAAVESGLFRRDLYYRVAAYPLRLPPLRDRREDVAPLARMFLARFAAAEESPARGFSPGALRLLARAPWPGNVRELENAVYRAVALAEGPELTEADFAHLAPETRPRERAASLFGPVGHVRKLAEVEADLIALALKRYDGRMAEAARRLGIGRSTLYRKIGEQPPPG